MEVFTYMTYEEFKAAICQQLRKQLPPDTSVQIQQILKNNGIRLDGLTISSRHSNVSPTIFLNHYYPVSQYFPDIDAICRDILLTYEQNKSPGHINVSFFTDYEKVKDRLAYRIVNFEKNKELLQTVPHIRYLDFAIVFYCLLKVSDKGNATILINSRHLKLWHITAAELYRQTSQTTPELLPCHFRSMSAVLSEMTDQKEAEASGAADSCPLYMLTNYRKLYGACCMLYPHLLEDISAKLNADLIILPSSIHELIIMPADSRSQCEELSGLVSEINLTELHADEVLSDHVYYYSREEQELSMYT